MRLLSIALAVLGAAFAGASQQLIECRVFGIDGEPVRDESIDVLFSVGALHFGGGYSTDATGALRITVPRKVRLINDGVVRLRHSGEPGGACRVDFALVRRNSTLGELRLRAEPRIASGRVIDPEGRPIAGAIVETFVGDSATAAWGCATWFFERSATTGADGHFVLRGLSVGRKTVELRASRDGYVLTSAPKALSPGSTQVRMVMTRTSIVRGQFVGLRGMSQFPGTVRMDAQGATPDPDSDTESFVMQSDGTFRITKLPGVYTLRIYLPGPRKPVHVVDDIRVRPGKPCHDPRLGGLDLTRILRVVRLDIRDPAGRPKRNAVCCYDVSSENGGAIHYYYTDTNGIAFVPVATEGGRVSIVDLDGAHRIVRFPSLKSDKKLQLAPAWRLEVRIKNLPALPRNTVWDGYLDTDPLHPRWGPQYPRAWLELDQSAAGTLTIMDRGRYTVTMYATRKDPAGKRDTWYSDRFKFSLVVDPDKEKNVIRAEFELSEAQLAKVARWK